MRARIINENVKENNKSQKLYENMQQAKSILKKHGLTKENETFQKLRELLGNKLGSIGKLTKWIFEEGYSFEQVKEAYELLIDNSDLGINILDKNIKNPEDIHDLVQNKKSSKDAQQMLRYLPKEIRNNVDDEFVELLENSTDVKDAIVNFFEEKSSRYRHLSIEDFKDHLKKKIKLFKNFSMDSIKKKIKTNNLENEVQIVAQKENEILVLKIESYKASNILGTVEWCISTSKSTFHDYADYFSNQFFIYDFRKDPTEDYLTYMVGVTIGPEGKISAAHYANDTEVGVKDYVEKLLSELE